MVTLPNNTLSDQIDTTLERELVYSLADRSVTITALDNWSADLVEKIFADWYLTPEIEAASSRPGSTIRIRSGIEPPPIPPELQQFEIAEGGVCHSNGPISYLQIQGSLVVIGHGPVDVEVWIDPLWKDDFRGLIPVISYAISAALRRCGLFELHSAAVVEPSSGKGVLIVGPSGSGKSTLTIQLSADGWPYLSDDVLVFGGEENDVSAWPLRRCFAVTKETVSASQLLQKQAALNSLASNAKARFSPGDVFSSGFKDGCTPRTLFFSQVAHTEQSDISPLTSGETMARLIRMSPWSCYDKSTAGEHLAALSRLVRQSKGFVLLAGKDLLVPGNSSRLLTGYVQI